MKVLKRVWQDVRARRNLESYVAALVAGVFAALGIVGDIVPEGLKWSAVFAGLGVLLFRLALPDWPSAAADALLADRDAFDRTPFPELIAHARQLWIFAPSAINVLSPANCEAIRKSVLDRGGEVRVVVLDPEQHEAVTLAVRHLDDSLQFQLQDFRASLQTSIRRLERMAAWPIDGFAYGFAGYNPGFSFVAVDPTTRDGRVIVEFHGYHNEATGSRMHLTLRRRDSDEWFRYWARQFEEIWGAARLPTSAQP
ncbi:hypothetical protein ACGFMK_24380 [Amycolatopsis sp. NPDC049252]|uniref:hypothetical protein n=1 Tax=Amycolatopsis sp. NPDC049252 TaxID=3363933 RepID=UPI00371663E4